MAIPVPTNMTCDLYRTGRFPPAAPDIAGIRFYMKPDWEMGQEHGDRPGSNGVVWTHIAYFGPTLDIRDSYSGAEGFGTKDFIYVPDQNGVKMRVVFVELAGPAAGGGGFKRAYLDRDGAPAWPQSRV